MSVILTIFSAMLKSLGKSILFWIVFIALLFIGGSSLVSFLPPEWSGIGYGLVGTICAYFTVLIFLRWDKLSFKEIGLVWERRTFVRFLVGILIGVGLMILILLVLVSFTELELEWSGKIIDVKKVVLFLAAIIPLGLMEELAFRTYPFLKLNKACGIWIAQLIMALAFAIYHILQGWSVYVSFLGPFVWAFVFGVAAIRSGGIALPAGIHVALNAMQSFTGIKENETSFLTLKFGDHVTKDDHATAEVVGAGIQVVIFLIAVLLTSRILKKQDLIDDRM